MIMRISSRERGREDRRTPNRRKHAYPFPWAPGRAKEGRTRCSTFSVSPSLRHSDPRDGSGKPTNEVVPMGRYEKMKAE